MFAHVIQFNCQTLCPLPEQRKLPAQRAKYEYLRGKILDVLPDYRKEAEDHLSKAVSNNALYFPVFQHVCNAQAEVHFLK